MKRMVVFVLLLAVVGVAGCRSRAASTPTEDPEYQFIAWFNLNSTTGIRVDETLTASGVNYALGGKIYPCVLSVHPRSAVQVTEQLRELREKERLDIKFYDENPEGPWAEFR